MNAHIHTKATNIQWDTDGDAKALSKLPGEIDIPDGMTDEDEISDYISNVRKPLQQIQIVSGIFYFLEA